MNYLKNKYILIKTIGSFLLILMFLSLNACGYSLSKSNYSLKTPLRVSIPTAKNSTEFYQLGPKITRLMVEELNSSPDITILSAKDQGEAILYLTIEKVTVTGGAWEVADSDYLTSVSQKVDVTVKGVLEMPSESSLPSKQESITVSRNYRLADNQSQLEINRYNALDLAIEEATKKIATSMFSEF